MSPILIGLGGTATGLGLIVTGVLMALWRKHAATPAKPKPPQQPSISTFAGKGEEEDGNPDLIPTTALTNHLIGNTVVSTTLFRRTRGEIGGSNYVSDSVLCTSILISQLLPPRRAREIETRTVTEEHPARER